MSTTAAASNSTQSGPYDDLWTEPVIVNSDGTSEPGTPSTIQDPDPEQESAQTPSVPISDAVAAKEELAPETQMAAFRRRQSPEPVPAEPVAKPKDIVVHQKGGWWCCCKRWLKS